MLELVEERGRSGGVGLVAPPPRLLVELAGELARVYFPVV